MNFTATKKQLINGETPLPVSKRELDDLSRTVNRWLSKKGRSKRFGMNVIILMAMQGLKQKDLGAQTGYDPSHVSRVLEGQANFQIMLLWSIARVLRVKPTTLLLADLKGMLRNAVKDFETPALGSPTR